ncbi:MAG TPA: Hsp20/alpha crystallin family protein [Tepidisphaeraceae bacterium]|nr:Hsp20/alpha crystallin family protein [Tepidisphaeraceae bacterium]
MQETSKSPAEQDESKRLAQRYLRAQRARRRPGTTFDYMKFAATARVASATNKVFMGETIMALPILVRRGFVDPIDYTQRDFNTMLNRFFGSQQDGGQMAPFGVDVREDGDHIYVEADLPGFKKEDIEITLENQTLTISAEHKEEHEEKGAMLLHERRYSQFLRSFTLPPTVDEKAVDAKLQDGVLKVTLNKREETKPRKVQVN